MDLIKIKCMLNQTITLLQSEKSIALMWTLLDLTNSYIYNNTHTHNNSLLNGLL